MAAKLTYADEEELRNLYERLQDDLAEAEENYEACEYDSVAWPAVVEAKGKLAGVEATLRALGLDPTLYNPR